MRTNSQTNSHRRVLIEVERTRPQGIDAKGDSHGLIAKKVQAFLGLSP